MKNFFRRGFAAAMGSIMLTLGAGNASAQSTQPLSVDYSLKRAAVATTAQPIAAKATAPAVSVVQKTLATTQNMFSNAVGAVFGTTIDPERAEMAKVAREAAWLRNAGWPLYGLVDRFGVTDAQLSQEAHCIAVAVYHEARGESLEGQLAVARVIMNRAASGKYPASWCATVKQPWQFSFVNPRTGDYPRIDESSASWRKAIGITRLATAGAYPSVTEDVLWYHATYVSPSWGRRLSRADKIGTHIFYRA